ncbi:hypothetical protein V1520DRAFT_366986 [Lipomyces starkeyi]|uniref:Homeobox domain-containing protein n=1 Tax=Lipomyces starkeyi NRRL Y-11557 TaxID=675824 RepID=A0A1E3Q9Y2_LIPST|nr:hypothetical protein LIPSTDRAFT_62519 [Lipomyces starkeyi NRRL Y-11557]
MSAHSRSFDLHTLANACEIAMPDLSLQRPQSFLQLTTTAIYTASGALLDNAIEYERAKIQAQSLCDIYYQASCARVHSRIRDFPPIFRNRFNQALLALKGDRNYRRKRVFEIRSRPSCYEMDILATICGLEYHQVKVWFANRRARSKSSIRLGGIQTDC